MAKAKESYEQWKQRKEREGTLPASGSQHTPSAAETDSGPKESYEARKARKESKQPRQTGAVNGDFIDRFLDDSSDYLSGAKKE